MILFTADTHVGDHRAINIARRLLATTAEMDEALIAGWNARVGAEDEVWHLGDVARRSDDVASLLGRLNVHKHLVRGNNNPPGTLAPSGWTRIHNCVDLEVDGRVVVLCHYPVQVMEQAAPRYGQPARPRPRPAEADAAEVRRRGGRARVPAVILAELLGEASGG